MVGLTEKATPRSNLTKTARLSESTTGGSTTIKKDVGCVKLMSLPISSSAVCHDSQVQQINNRIQVKALM